MPPPRTTAKDRDIAVNGITIHVTEYDGTGPRLLLLHGISSAGFAWWPVIDDLAAHFRLLVPDLRGHGASAKPESGYLMTDYVADLSALLAWYQLAHQLVIGHSLGGLIALSWASTVPDRAAAIVVEDTTFRAGRPEAFARWLTLNAMSMTEASAAYQRESPTTDADAARRRAEAMTSTATAVFTEIQAWARANPAHDYISDFASIESPTLLIHGDDALGGAVSTDDAARFVATLPDAQAAFIPGVGHSVHRDAPAAFLARAIPFLLEHPETSADQG